MGPAAAGSCRCQAAKTHQNFSVSSLQARHRLARRRIADATALGIPERPPATVPQLRRRACVPAFKRYDW